MKKYYKVCYKAYDFNNITLKSYNSSSRNQAGTTNYRIGEWVKPSIEHSYLWIFESEYAARYNAVRGGTQLFECEAKNVIKAPALMILDREKYMLFWKNVAKIRQMKKSISKEVNKFLNADKNFITCPSMEGTLWCSELKLTKAIKW